MCPRGTQTCTLAVANIAHAVYLLDVAKRPIPQVNGNGKVILDTHPESDQHQN